MELPQFIKLEIEELSRAKAGAAFVLFAGLVFGASSGWWLASTVYAEHIAVMGEQISALEKGIVALPPTRESSSPNMVALAIAALFLAISAGTIPSAIRNKRLVDAGIPATVGSVDECDSLRLALTTTEHEQERLHGQLGDAQEALRTCRRETAIGKLGLLAWRYQRDKRDVSVMVRFIDYSDHKLADSIKALFLANTPWPTETSMVDGSTLRPAGTGQDRIEFATGFPDTAFAVATIFNNGNLLQESVLAVEIIDSNDSNIVVTIFPRSMRTEGAA